MLTFLPWFRVRPKQSRVWARSHVEILTNRFKESIALGCSNSSLVADAHLIGRGFVSTGTSDHSSKRLTEAHPFVAYSVGTAAVS